jgi:hypothetical protein
MGGSGNQQVTTTRTDPYAPAEPGLQKAIGQADALYAAGGPNVYSGERVAGFTQDQLNAFGAGRAGAGQLQAGGSDTRALDAHGTILRDQMATATGNPMMNPYAQDIIRQQAGDMTDQMNRQFAGSGRLGSYANARSVTDNTGRFLTQAYGDMYDRGMNQKNQAAQTALQTAGAMPGLYQQNAGMTMGAHDALSSIGSQQQKFSQQSIGAGMDYFNEQQSRPYNNLSHGGGSTNATSGNQTSPLQTILGLGLGGLGLFGGMF